MRTQLNEIVLCTGAHEKVTAIATRTTRAEAAVLFLNGGVLPRVGPNRLYVKCARELAKQNLIAVRFDHLGLGNAGTGRNGESQGAKKVRETREVLDALEAHVGSRPVALVGLCSGARTALMVAHEDPRVMGVVCINPSFYHTSDPNILDRRPVAVAKRAIKAAVAGYQVDGENRQYEDCNESRDSGSWADRILELSRCGSKLGFIVGENEPDLDFIRRMTRRIVRNTGAANRTILRVVRDADHIFTPLNSQEFLIEALCDWFCDNGFVPVVMPS